MAKKTVKVGMTIHKIGKFQPVDTTVKANLEIYFTYKKDEIYPIFKKYYKGDNFEDNFKFPFLISNAVDYNEDQHFTMIKTYDDNINYHEFNYDVCGSTEFILEKYMVKCELEVVNFTNLLPFNKMIIPINIITNGCPGSDQIRFVEETKIPNYDSDMSNQEIYIFKDDNDKYFFRFCDEENHNDVGMFSIETIEDKLKKLFVNKKYNKFKITKVFEDEEYCISTIDGSNLNTKIKFTNKWIDSKIKFENETLKKYDYINNFNLVKKDDIVWGKFIDRKQINYNPKKAGFCAKLNQYFYNSWDWYHIVHPKEAVHKTKYDRIYFVLSYSFGIKEDIVKYYFIPIILTLNIVIFNSVDLSTFAGLFPTIMLGNIALLFIQPETGKFTFNEKSVHLNVILTIILSCLKVLGIPFYFGNLFWILIILLLNFINLIYNVYVSIRTINSIDNIIFNNSKIKYLEKLFNSEYTELLLTNSGENKEELIVEKIKPYSTDEKIVLQQNENLGKSNYFEEIDLEEDNYKPVYIEMTSTNNYNSVKRNKNIDSIV